MTISYLSDAENAAVERLAQKRDMSVEAVLRQAVRLYQMVDAELENGNHMRFYSKVGERTGIPPGLPAFD